MGIVYHKRPWDRPPPIGTPIDRSNPLAQKLVAFVYVDPDAALPYEAVTGSYPSSLIDSGADGTVTLYSNTRFTGPRINVGPGLKYTVNSNSIKHEFVCLDEIAQDKGSMFIVCEQNASGNTYRDGFRVQNGGGNRFANVRVRRNGNARYNNIIFEMDFQAGGVTAGMLPNLPNNTFFVDTIGVSVVGYDVGASEQYIIQPDGHVYTETDSGSNDQALLTTIHFGNDTNVSSDLIMYAGGWWNGRTLSHDEAQAFKLNPWQVFEPELIPVFVPDGGAASFTYTATMSGIGSSGLTDITSRFRAYTYAGTGGSALSRALGLSRSLTYSGAGSSAGARVTDRFRAHTYSGTGTVAESHRNIILRAFAMIGTGAATLARGVGKAFSHSGVGTVGTPQKGIGKSISYSGVGSSVVSKITGYLRSYTYTGVGTASPAQVRSVIQQAAVMAGVGTGTLAKGIGKVFSYTGAGSSSTPAKAIGKNVAYSGTGSLTSAFLSGYHRAFTYSGVGTSVGAQSTSPTVVIDITGIGTPSINRGIGKALNFVGIGTVVQTNDGTPEVPDGMQVGDDDWWRWRRIMWRRNRKP